MRTEVSLDTGEEARRRAIYDWVVGNTFREGSARGCGTGDIRHMLETGWLGGTCADIIAPMTGLGRAAGIPAWDVHGTRVAPSAHSRSLGVSAGGDITRAQHCRSEARVGGRRVPVDVPKVVLEEEVPIGNAHATAQTGRMFGTWERNRVGFNSATNPALPGAPREMGADLPIYPTAMTGGKDCLNPATFRYAIGARKLGIRPSVGSGGRT